MELILQILGLAYFIFALWNLRLAVLLLPLFFPAYLLKFDLGGVPFPLVEVFIYGAFSAWIFRTAGDLLRRKISWSDIVKPFKSPLWLGVLVIVIAAIISVAIVPEKVALGIFKSWIVAPILMLMLFAVVMRGARDLALALNCYVVSAVFLSLWAIYQALTGQYITIDARASGPFVSANYLALYITPALFYALVRLKDFLFVEHEAWWKKIFHFLRRDDQQQRPRIFLVVLWSLVFLLLFFALLFTKSYAAFLSFFVACLLWFVQIKPTKKFPWKVIGGVVCVLFLIAAVLIFMDPVKWQNFLQLTSRSSSTVRLEIYTIATQLVASHPLQGIGLGMFPAVYQLEGARILGHAPYEMVMLHPHNVFLAFWLNLGLLGLLSFLWVLKVCFQKSWVYLKKMRDFSSSSVEWFRGLGFLMLVILLVHGLVDTPFFKNDLSLLFWLVVAVIMF